MTKIRDVTALSDQCRQAHIFIEGRSMEPTEITYGAAMTACSRGSLWQQLRCTQFGALRSSRCRNPENRQEIHGNLVASRGTP